jgi:hypothetical protein
MSGFPFTLGPLGSIFPLSGNPYWSRTTIAEIQTAPAKNYFLMAFKPGLPLQASELNEMQEVACMQNTLTSTMMASWPIYLASHTGSNPIYGPGWNGTTPLYPQFDDENTTTNMVGISAGISAGSPINRILVKKGWYLMTIKSSALKHWIYLNNDYAVDVPSDNNYTYYLGFTASYDTVKPSEDPALYDNSSGTTIIVGAPAGADRITVNISAPFWTIDKNTADFSAMIKKINTDGDILYMNNVPVPGE